MALSVNGSGSLRRIATRGPTPVEADNGLTGDAQTPYWCMRSTSPALRASLARVLANGAIPGTIRALAREANVPHSTLVRVANGGLDASPSVVERVADALESWRDACANGAAELRQSLRSHSARRL